MRKILLLLSFAILSFSVTLPSVGCNDGPVENGAEKIDEAIEEVADEIDDATDDN